MSNLGNPGERPEPEAAPSQPLGARTQLVQLRDLGIVASGGAVGSLLRYVLTMLIDGGKVSPAMSGGFPLATCVVNIVGACCLGLLLELATRHTDDRWRRLKLLLGTGVFGGFTTYSLLAADTAQLLLGGAWGVAVLYGLGTIVAAMLASWVGILAGRALGHHRADALGGPDARGGDTGVTEEGVL